MVRARLGAAGAVLLAALAVVVPTPAGAGTAGGPTDEGPAAHWTAARRAAATPRDLVVDERGLGYLRRADGTLQPHGHSRGQLYAAPTGTSRPTPAARPGGGGSTDTTGPTITNRVPADGATIGASHSFSANVTDASGVRSVTFVITYPNGTQTQSFAATRGSGDTWSATLNGFTPGSWTWRVVAKDAAGKRGNTTTSPIAVFTVGGGTGGGGTVTNSPWTGDGTVQTAAGRIYFEMQSSPGKWSGYVCSGTVADDATTGRSVIITAAHCVYDDVYKTFARNIIFIPNQDGTSGTGTDRNCANDPIGCWTTSFGVVDTDWSTRTFPDNIPWDYAYYVVADSGAHSSGLSTSSDVLDAAAGDLLVQFSAPTMGSTTHALGYSYSDDPNFMYCAEGLGIEGASNWWLGQCDLSGGSSGGPWLQPVDAGNGPIVSVNSWGYTNQPGMAGPKLSGSSAGCVFGVAKTTAFDAVTNRGVATAC